jgi:hypothetical protein
MFWLKLFTKLTGNFFHFFENVWVFQEFGQVRSKYLNDFHHRPREIGQAWLWAELKKKIARFKTLENSSIYFQNDLAFLGRIGKPSLSEFPEIYVFIIQTFINSLESAIIYGIVAVPYFMPFFISNHICCHIFYF